MWAFLQGIQEQVTKYSTWLGQLWYLCVFVFRLIVVVTIGGAVYGGELGEFSCNTVEPGCKTMCFNQFNKISHIRFWSFQLLAIATPTVLFHFYSTSVAGKIKKIEQEQEKLKKIDDARSEYSVAPPNPYEEDTEENKQKSKLEKQKKKIGNVKFKKVYTGSEIQQVPFTNKIHIAYYINVILRVVLEAIFISLAHQLFKTMDLSNDDNDGEVGPLDFLVFSVPAMYQCAGLTADVKVACSQALLSGGGVPCWVSRPWEKTILIRYMNVFSSICFLLSAAEFVYLTVKGFLGQQKWIKNRMIRGLSGNSIRGDTSYAGSQNYQMTIRSMPNTYYTPSTMNGNQNTRYRYNNHSPAMTERIPLSVVGAPIRRAASMRTVTSIGMPNSVSMMSVADRSGASSFQRMMPTLPGADMIDTRSPMPSNDLNNGYNGSELGYAYD